MTYKRKNEIWAMLNADAKMAMSRLWHNTSLESDETKLLEMLFGKHNLTVPPDKKDPKSSSEPRFKVSDRIMVLSGNYQNFTGTIKEYSEDDDTWAIILDGFDYPIHFDESHIEHYFGKSSEENPLDVTESVETNIEEDAYFAYRLDLAKEIAVAMTAKSSMTTHIPQCAVGVANEIVKRLKETEI